MHWLRKYGELAVSYRLRRIAAPANGPRPRSAYRPPPSAF